MKTRFALVMILLCCAGFISYNPREVVEPEAKSLRDFPRHIGSWQSRTETTFDVPTLDLLRPTDYLMRTYANPDGRLLGLYVGYHNGGKNSGPIHSPRNCLPSTGWLLLSAEEVRIGAGEDALPVIRARYAKESRQLTCYYWYQVRGKSMTGDLERKIAELVGMVTERRKDASFIRIDLPAGPEAVDDALARDFLENAFPLLRRYLPS